MLSDSYFPAKCWNLILIKIKKNLYNKNWKRKNSLVIIWVFPLLLFRNFHVFFDENPEFDWTSMFWNDLCATEPSIAALLFNVCYGTVFFTQFNLISCIREWRIEPDAVRPTIWLYMLCRRVLQCVWNIQNRLLYAW